MTGSRIVLTRRALLTGAASAAGLALTGCTERLPPTYGNVLRMSDNLSYATHRLLIPRHALAKEYGRGDVTSFPAIGTTNPADPAGQSFSKTLGPEFARLMHGEFADYRLQIDGHVARPGSYSLADLKRFAPRTQITKHTCEEGWSAIGEWTGTPLARVLVACGALPGARFVNFHTFDDWDDSIDMVDALHPQTILAWGMNGRDLPLGHGAPLRLRVETQLGYKSLKFLQRMTVTQEFFDPAPEKQATFSEGWAWYAGI